MSLKASSCCAHSPHALAKGRSADAQLFEQRDGAPVATHSPSAQHADSRSLLNDMKVSKQSSSDWGSLSLPHAPHVAGHTLATGIPGGTAGLRACRSVSHPSAAITSHDTPALATIPLASSMHSVACCDGGNDGPSSGIEPPLHSSAALSKKVFSCAVAAPPAARKGAQALYIGNSRSAQSASHVVGIVAMHSSTVAPPQQTSATGCTNS